MEEFDDYFKEIKIEAKSGQSTELTFRTPLKNFLENKSRDSFTSKSMTK